MHLINDPGLVTRPARVVGAPRPGEARMQMLYGVNQADQCWDFAVGPHRERTWEQLRRIDTRMIRLFLFDKGGPDAGQGLADFRCLRGRGPQRGCHTDDHVREVPPAVR